MGCVEKKFMDTIKCLFQSALKHHQAGDLAMAAYSYTKILDHQPEHVDVLFLLGTLNLQLKNYDSACVLLRKTLRLKPDYGIAHGNLGSSLQGLGRLEEATVSYQQAVAHSPDYADGYYNLANTLKEMGKLEEAVKNYKKVIELRPDDAETYTNLGNALREQKRLNEAVRSYRKALYLDPENDGIRCNLGAALQEMGKFDEATEIYRMVLRLKPGYVKAYNNLGTVLKEQHKLDEAIASYKQAIELKPDYAEAYDNLGLTLQKQGKAVEAANCHKRAIALKPDFVEAFCNLGAAFQGLGRLEEAIDMYERATALRPDYVIAYNNMGDVFKMLGKYDKAEASYVRSMEIEPDNATVCGNLGIVLHEQGKLDEAITHYRQAISLKPDYAEAHSNLGAALQEQGKLPEAVVSSTRATDLKPDFAMAHMNKSIALLLSGNYQDGWTEYEWRLRRKDYNSRKFIQPQWDGSSFNNRSVLVHAEQGFGDTIQFVRYLPMVQSRGGRVVFECQQALLHLLQNCAGFDEIIENVPARELSVNFDLHVPLMSLPGIFGTTMDTIPSHVPYITVDSVLLAKWRKRLEHDKFFKIGLAWAGRTSKNYVYANRSRTLNDFTLLTEIPGLTFYALQKGPASVEALNPPERMKIINLESELHDFSDTAAVIANLDLVISVDTAVVHLAGAIGKPVWTLLPFAPDWRWMLKRADSPWYPSMRLFRQTRSNDWTSVFEQVKEALRGEIVDCNKRFRQAR